ncbi:pyridine nucleotide-disulfide oxidoreductase/dicluster-binding protein [Synergistes jonesii]|uniref:pyridine nucleotide-disulfide oxidoreductase/dicluster-binding protein n=1 Tax=Synergistes jonesii TaxID=2754 RepID=UPI00248E08D3|nr:pyridine nucleotide-disulfide oxidoreductase/dicluster-binding protein [Synergistes jonesii]
MDETVKNQIRNCCLEKEAAPCVSACPFHFDVREFIPKARRGAFNSAYRAYANAVAFPRIVSQICGEPCRAGCPLKDRGGAVNLKLIEQAVVKSATRTAPNSYNLPAKGKRIAVIGGGAGGLACALRLCNKKYDVTVYEKTERLGGRLWETLSPDIFLKDIEEQFSKEKYELLLGREIGEIDEIREKFDAVYVATGRGGESFGLLRACEMREPSASSLDGVFLGGALLGASPVEAIAQGAAAAGLIEGYLKTGIAKSAEPHPPTRIKLNLDGVETKPEVLPASSGGYSGEEAAAEALRCIRCRCDSCVRACDMMAYFQKFPKLIEEEVHITIYPGTLDGNGTVATRLISTCNQCGLCGKVCPEKIDVGLFMRESHIAMREKKAMPWAFHEFWLNDMDFSRSERARFFYAPAGKCDYLFFPGCQMGASEPDYVTKTYALLRELAGPCAVYVTCCGAPALWAGDRGVYEGICGELRDKWRQCGEPEIIFGCPTCREMMNRRLPEMKGRMLSDLLWELGAKIPDAQGAEVSLFDPCSARDFPETQRNVRALLSSAGYALRPLEYEKERAKCCSWGGQISIANPPYARWLVEKRLSEGEAPYVVYCTNCRDVFADAGKPVRHILDLLFGLEREGRTPTYSKRRDNREEVKRLLTKELLGRELPEKEKIPLFISPELEAKMNRDRILEEDVASVIAFCERTGRKLVDERGHFIGYGEIGHITCWAEYSPEKDGYRVHNAYPHRMKIELEEVWHGRKTKADL